MKGVWMCWVKQTIDRFYLTLLSAFKQTEYAPVARDFLNVWLRLLWRVYLVSTEVVYWQRCLVFAWLVPYETAAVSAQILCTPHNHAPVYNAILFKTTCVGCMCV